jgi:tetratricopeptide (TPR) repeat protein
MPRISTKPFLSVLTLGLSQKSRPLSQDKDEFVSGRAPSSSGASLGQNLIVPSKLKAPSIGGMPQAEELVRHAKLLISTPPIQLDRLLEAETCLRAAQKTPQFKNEAQLWLLISQRLRGMEVTAEFALLHAKMPENRLCFLNLCASFFSPEPSVKDLSDALSILRRLQAYIKTRPSDTFALLLEALMIECFADDVRQSIECLESLYLKNSIYTPAISYMACALRQFGYDDSARDYLDEALRKDPNNVQALLLDRYLRGSIRGKRCVPDPIKHIDDAPYPTRSYSVLLVHTRFRIQNLTMTQQFHLDGELMGYLTHSL